MKSQDLSVQTDETAGAAAFDAEATARMLGLSELQFKFGMARLRGANQTQAARIAGFNGDAAALRSAGHRAMQSAKVRRFLELAALEGGELTDQPMDAAERRRILSRIARGSDRSAAIRAAEVMHRMDVAEGESRKDDPPREPGAILDDIAELAPELAVLMAADSGVHWVPGPQVSARAEQARQRIALEYLQSKRVPANVIPFNPGGNAA